MAEFNLVGNNLETCPPRRGRALLVMPLLCLLLLLSLAAPARALDPRKALTQYMHDVWTAEEGLPQNAVISIAQTADGYLWFGSSEEGLARYDGVAFRLYNVDNTPAMRSNAIMALIADEDGALWVCTSGGLVHIKKDEIKSYTSAEGLSSDVVTSIARDRDGSFVIGTRAGLNRLKDGKFTVMTTADGLPHNTITAVRRDRRDGTLWVGTLAGLAHLAGDRIEVFTAKDGLTGDVVTRIHQDRQGDLWLGAGAGLTHFKDGKFTRYTAREGLAGNGVAAIQDDRDGNIWIGVAGGGLQRLRDGEFTTFSTKEGLTDKNVVSVFEDREGSLWFGTPSAGLHRFRDGKFTSYTAEDGLADNFVNQFLETRDGDFWIGTRGGLNLLRKDGTFSLLTTRDNLADNFSLALHEDRKGRMWVGSVNGVSVVERGRVVKTYTTKDGLPRNIVNAIYADQNGNMWLGTAGGGLSRLRDGAFTNFTKQDGLPSDLVTRVREDSRGNLWIGTYDAGLCVLRDGKFTTFGEREGFPVKNTVGSIYEDRAGVMWVGTFGSGLIRYADGKFTTISAKDGLYDSKVFGIVEDDEGNFWMSSNKGVFRTPRAQLEEFAAGKRTSIECAAYGTADGMENRECNSGGYQASDGRIWYGTVKGAVVIDPQRAVRNDVLPPVHIERVAADGATISTDKEIVLAPGTARLEFDYAGLSFVAPEKVQYKYRLEGLDRDWTDAGSRRAAFYTNVPPGSYTFRVIAANNDGVWNEAGASVRLRLRPRFYQTNWFLGICAAGLVVTGVGANGLRVLRLKRQRARLVEMVKERTRDLAEEKEKVERQKRLIEADNERKTQELEEARRLQLSMLPKKLPDLPHLEVAAYMKPATEVGGDYYDFHTSPDGTLTVIVGDATGHGLKAGTMVTATKSLFEMLAPEPDVLRTLAESNRVLRGLKLRGLFMALALVKVSGTRLIVAIAGMPPVLIHRAATGEVEEANLRGAPLGSLKQFDYRLQEFDLAHGDTVLLMSDGFPERFNEEGEMLDYTRARDVLRDVAREDAQTIVARFVQIGDEWAGARPQDDDVTFVVLKCREVAT